MSDDQKSTAAAEGAPVGDKSVKADPASTPPLLSFIPIRLVDGGSPFPLLALYRLTSVPRPGDGIQIDISGRTHPYKVVWVNFTPLDNVSHISLGCLPNGQASDVGLGDESKLKDRKDSVINMNLQLFEKGEAYSKAIILLGYAGFFGIWSFAKDVLSARATEYVALLVGFSLMIYVIWEIMEMIRMVTRHNRFNALVQKEPSAFFSALSRFDAENQTALIDHIRLWRVVLFVTVGFGFAGALLLFWNCFAKLTNAPTWP